MLCDVIAEFIAKRYDGKLVEVGIGNYHCVARKLSDKGFKIVATDFRTVEGLPNGVEFHVDDIMNPNLDIYKGASLIYSLRPPLELYPYIVAVAKAVKADCLIRPFGNEFATDGKLINYKGEKFYVWFNRR